MTVEFSSSAQKTKKYELFRTSSRRILTDAQSYNCRTSVTLDNTARASEEEEGDPKRKNFVPFLANCRSRSPPNNRGLSRRQDKCTPCHPNQFFPRCSFISIPFRRQRSTTGSHFHHHHQSSAKKWQKNFPHLNVDVGTGRPFLIVSSPRQRPM